MSYRLRMDTAAYLERLGVPAPGAPSVAGLRALHAAHVERVAYEVLDIHLGRPTEITPEASAERVCARGRGGYCYHLNGAFSLLLDQLGYDVVWHRAGVQNWSDPEPPGPPLANHLALTVHGLPSDECPEGTWLADVGLGDALHDPLPLRAGRYEQGPFTYELRPSEVAPGGWRFDHDPGGSFAGMDFRLARATVPEFAARHEFLSTSPDSGFMRVCTVQRRDAGGVDRLDGRVLRRVGDGAREHTLTTAAAWYAVLADRFGLALRDIDAADRERLWARVCAAHEAWQVSVAGRSQA